MEGRREGWREKERDGGTKRGMEKERDGGSELSSLALRLLATHVLFGVMWVMSFLHTT